MNNWINRKTAAVIAGAVLLAWSISSAFINPSPSSATALELEEKALEAYDQSLVQQEGSVSTAFPAPENGASEPLPAPSQTLAASPSEKLAPTRLPQSAQPTEGSGPDWAPLDIEGNAFSVPEATAPARPTPEKVYIPDRIVIPKIALDAPVEIARYRMVDVMDTHYVQWLAPSKFASGWHADSATLGVPGNTVLNGHHNVFGEVFGGLVDLSVGDRIEVYSGEKMFEYEIAKKLLVPEIDQPLSVRLKNAAWLMPTGDERLTLVTCWPPEGNSHRIFIIAFPVDSDQSQGQVQLPEP